MITFIFVKFVKGKYNRNWYVSVISVIVGSLAFMGISTLVMWIAGVPLVSFLYLLYIGVPFIGYNAVCAFLLHRPLWYFKLRRISVVMKRRVPGILENLLKNKEETRYANLAYVSIVLLTILSFRLFLCRS